MQPENTDAILKQVKEKSLQFEGIGSVYQTHHRAHNLGSLIH